MADTLAYQGRVWRFGNNVDYPRAALKDHAMAGSPVADFAKRVLAGDIIVAGDNFGCGSSREQAPVALKEAGVALVVAKSFARIFRRNAINIGLAVLQADVAAVDSGDIITADIKSGTVTLADGRVIQGLIPGENVVAILAAGGLINKVRQQLQSKGV
jgi:3-isopropylmalate dehydratase small subunit